MGDHARPGRNDRCPCGSGRKYKVCCGAVRAPLGARLSEQAASLARAGGALVAARRFEEAYPSLAQAAALAPSDPQILDALGTACLFSGRLEKAVGCLRSSVQLRPMSAPTLFRLGLALAQVGDSDGALAAQLRATEVDPGLAEAHGRVGDLLMRKGRPPAAALAYRRAFEAASATTYGRLCGAKGLAAEGRSGEAEARLAEILVREPEHVEALFMLGNLQSEAGRFEEAAASYGRSIELAPWQTTAYHGLVTARKMTEADRPFVERMLSRLKDARLAARQRMMLHFSAGKALDDLGDHAGAMIHFDAANAVRRQVVPFDRPALEARVDRIIGRYTRELFARHKALGRADVTPVLVLGMPRSGTTMFERVLSSHPQVAGGGELAYWEEQGPRWADASDEDLAQVAASLSGDYLALLRSVGPTAARVTDKMPFNFFWIGLVHLLLPEARFIRCRRSPIDTCLSVYTTHFAPTWRFASDRGDLVFYYRQYERLMEHWRAVLPEGVLLEVDYEVATADPEPTARRMVEHVGLPWDAACLAPERNPDAVRTANKWHARQPVYTTSVERWRRYEPWIGELRELLPGEGGTSRPATA